MFQKILLMLRHYSDYRHIRQLLDCWSWNLKQVGKSHQSGLNWGTFVVHMKKMKQVINFSLHHKLIKPSSETYTMHLSKPKTLYKSQWPGLSQHQLGLSVHSVHNQPKTVSTSSGLFQKAHFHLPSLKFFPHYSKSKLNDFTLIGKFFNLNLGPK